MSDDGLRILVFVLAMLALAAAPWAYVILARYLLVPLWGRNEPILAEPEMIRLDVAEMPPDIARVFRDAARQLATVGFTASAHVRVVGQIRRSDGYVSFWLHPDPGTSAQVIGVKASHPSGVRVDAYAVTLCTEFNDKSAVVTTNERSLGVFRSDPLCDTVAWRGMDDLGVLYRFHLARVAPHLPTKTTFLPPPDEDSVIAYARRSSTESLWRQVSAGYFWFDAAGGSFRKTTKGSFLMVWKLLWPWRDLRLARDDAKLRRELHARGMGRPEDYVTQSPTAEPAESTLSYARPLGASASADDDGGDDDDDDDEVDDNAVGMK